MSRARIAASCTALVLLAGDVCAHVRLINPSNGLPLHWASPSAVSIVINATGSANVQDGSHVPALQLAIRAWNDANGTTAQLVENTSPAQRARSDWSSDTIHMIFFDETDASGYFASSSGIVAITPVWFTSNGTITDADVLFNGNDHLFTTNGQLGAFDIEDTATHELGHLLGLDHSGWAGATMYPYVDPTIVLHRSLSEDDECGMRNAYPGSTWANIAGRIVHGDSSIVPGAHVVARGSDGRPFAAGLAGNDGRFLVDGLPAGSYVLYASPFDAPVSSGNLGGGHTIATDFRSTVFGTFAVTSGQALDVGDQIVDADSTLGLGRNTDAFPLRAIAGQTKSFVVHGSGLAAGSTLEASDPLISVTPLAWNNTSVSFSATVPADSSNGHCDLTVMNAAGEISILCAGLEITPPTPTVTSVDPTSGSFSGGTEVTVFGTGFKPGARVVLGNEVYVDGDVGGCSVIDDGTIVLTTRACAAGTYDAVVVDASGVEGRAASAFVFQAQPAITSIFPTIGWAGGGTTVVLRGSDFVAGSTVSIDGTNQPAVTIVDSSTIRIVTTAGVAGGPYVVDVVAPGGADATIAFSYAFDPDPMIDTLAPTHGTTAGGSVVTIHGANFAATTDVFFGADENTGTGGTLGLDVTWVDANTLRVTTPANAAGTTNVMVRDELTDQASVAVAAFTFAVPGKSGGGGCSIAPMGDKRGPFDGGAGFGAVILAFIVLLARSRRMSADRARA